MCTAVRLHGCYGDTAYLCRGSRCDTAGILRDCDALHGGKKERFHISGLDMSHLETFPIRM